MSNPDPQELRALYGRRFQLNQAYRQRVWRVLVDHFFQQHIPAKAAVLDLGCGYGEFINNVHAHTKYGMDLNAATRDHLTSEVQFLLQDCASNWPFPESVLDVVFTSNFFEHLPDKETLGRTLVEAHRCLKPGGKLIALGPNIKHVPGQYWDFWDHYLPLTETSLSEGLTARGFGIEHCHSRFLPYTMAGGREYPSFLLIFYIKLPWAWRFFGKQFLVIARKERLSALQ